MTLHRKTPLKRNRRANLKPRKAVPAKNGKRREKAFARAYGSKARVQWVRSLPCCCGCGRSPSDNAHTETGGMGRKAHYRTIAPLYRECHRAYDLHQAPFDTPLARLAVKVHAAATAARWDRMGGLEPVGAIVPRVLAELGEDAEC